MTKSFHGKVVLITGGASGIGRVAAGAFAERGASVVVSDQAIAGGQETVGMITKAGGKSVFVKADVTQAPQVKALILEVERAYGRLDFALNNAGIDGARANTADYPEEIWSDVMNVNLTGVFLCMKYEIPLMLRQPGSVIINLSSVAGVTGFPARGLHRKQAWRHRPDKDRCARIRQARPSRQRPLPCLHAHPDGRADRPGETRLGSKAPVQDPHRQVGYARGNCRCRHLPLY